MICSYSVLHKYRNSEVKFVVIAIYSRYLDLTSKDEYEAKVEKVSLYLLVFLCIHVLPSYNNSTFFMFDLYVIHFLRITKIKKK